ncbi:hypothetical protein Tco_0074687, partial [Tanacetum coccineum]
ERNLRRFQFKKRPASDLCGIIRDNVRLRILSLKIRSSRQAMEATELWDVGLDKCNGGMNFSLCSNG